MSKFFFLVFMLVLVTNIVSKKTEVEPKTEEIETKIEEIKNKAEEIETKRGKCEPSVTTASGTYAPREICSGQLIFEDNFDTLNFGKWQHENTLSGGGNWEFQWYTNNRSNSYARDGSLFIKPTLTADFFGEENLSRVTLDLAGGNEAEYCTDGRSAGCLRTGTPTNILNPIRSAKLTTVKSFSFKYGTIKIRAKLPRGDWLWPAIWMLSRYNGYGNWPTSGEIDILESRGNENLSIDGTNIGVERAESTLHWGPSANHNQFTRTQFHKDSPDGNYDFKVYELYWTPEFLRFRVDDEDMGIVQLGQSFWDFGQLDSSGMSNPWIYGSNMAPFDQEFYLIFNVAVGGTTGFFPDNVSNPSPKPWSNTSPQAMTDFWNNRGSWLPTWQLDQNNGEKTAMQIDYVQVWAL